jgi:hypothetical protein
MEPFENIEKLGELHERYAVIDNIEQPTRFVVFDPMTCLLVTCQILVPGDVAVVMRHWRMLMEPIDHVRHDVSKHYTWAVG